MATVLSLINQVLLRTGQATITTVATASAPAAQALEFLNIILLDLYRVLNPMWLYESGTITTTTGQSSYSLPSAIELDNLLDYTLCEETNKVPLRQVPASHVSKLKSSTTGKPGFFWMQSGKVSVWPTPDADYTLNFLYKPKPATLTSDTQHLDLPQQWQEVLVTGTQAYLERFLGEPNAGDSFALYQQQLASLKRQNSRQKGQRIRSATRLYRQRFV